MTDDLLTASVCAGFGLVLGIFCGIPIGYFIAQALKPKLETSAQPKQREGVSFTRDAQGRITEVVPLPMGET